MDLYPELTRSLSSWSSSGASLDSVDVDVKPKMVKFADWHDTHRQRAAQAPADVPDDAAGLVALLRQCMSAPAHARSLDMIAVTLRCIKILSRREINRRDVRRAYIVAVVDALKHSTVVARHEAAAYDAATYLQNVFHDTMTCLHCPDAVATLVGCLGTDATSDKVKAACLAALQNATLQRIGQEAIISCRGVEVLVGLLFHGVDTVVRGTVATLHNTVASIEGCVALLRAGGVPYVASLLSYTHDSAVLRSVVGIVQNLCREKQCVEVLLEVDVATQLTALLSHRDAYVTSAVVGALMNLCSSVAPGNTSALSEVLSSHIVVSTLAEALR